MSKRLIEENNPITSLVSEINIMSLTKSIESVYHVSIFSSSFLFLLTYAILYSY